MRADGGCDPGFSVGSGGRSPGVALGEGKVYLGTRDGFLIALDQMTGGQVWKTEVLPWRKGGNVSDAPIYVNGMVITGDSGADGGVSNGMHAFSADNGRRLWTWAIVPQHGQPGGNTWTGTDSNYGGGAIWETPIVDTKLKLLIFGTGNPVPWNSRGPGMNLYTDSIVALNLYTGQLVWAFQTAHHDLWDSDLPNNPVAFDGKFKVPVTVTKQGPRQGQGQARHADQEGQDDRPEDAPGHRLREQVWHDVHPRPRDRQAADPDPGGQGPAAQVARREHVADPAGPADRERPVQQARQRTAARAPTATSRRPTRTSRSRRRPRPTASRTRSVARTTRTTRRSTS